MSGSNSKTGFVLASTVLSSKVGSAISASILSARAEEEEKLKKWSEKCASISHSVEVFFPHKMSLYELVKWTKLRGYSNAGGWRVWVFHPNGKTRLLLIPLDTEG